MATRRRRRTTTRRRRRTTVTNPRRRRAQVTHRRHRRRTAPRVSRRRRSLLNPRRRHHRRRRVNRSHRRRRNPSGLLGSAGGLLQKGLTAVIGMAITNFGYNLIAQMNPAGMLGQIGFKLGIAWGLGTFGKRFGFAAQSDMLAIGGVVSAGQDAFNYFIGGGGLLFPSAGPALPAGRVALPAAMTGDDSGGGTALSDIVSVPTNWGNLGEIVSAPTWQGYYQ